MQYQHHHTHTHTPHSKKACSTWVFWVLLLQESREFASMGYSSDETATRLRQGASLLVFHAKMLRKYYFLVFGKVKGATWMILLQLSFAGAIFGACKLLDTACCSFGEILLQISLHFCYFSAFCGVDGIWGLLYWCFDFSGATFLVVVAFFEYFSHFCGADASNLLLFQFQLPWKLLLLPACLFWLKVSAIWFYFNTNAAIKLMYDQLFFLLYYLA